MQSNFWRPKPDRRAFLKGGPIAQMAQELRIRGFSRATVVAYCYAVQKFLSYVGADIVEAGSDDVKSFIDDLLKEGRSARTCNLALNAIKFFFKIVLKQPLDGPLPTVKRPKTLPIVFSQEEIRQLLAVVKNKKHHLLLSLAYGAGLRVSEVVKLKVDNIDFARNLLMIRQAKGGKDRLSLIPIKLVDDLKEICGLRRGDELVFVSERGGALNVRTAQQIFYSALRVSQIKKTASFHSLRHSFATHMIENGTDIRFIQELLGHENIRTTQGYTRVASHALARLASPLDCIG